MLAKWCAGKHNAKVVFDAQATGASANVEKNEIYMPCDLKEHNVFAGLALLMHEAGHLKHSNIKKAKEVSENRSISFNILNAIEDIRIDQKNFNILYNIRDFYQKLVDGHVYPRAQEMMKEHIMTRCLINGILQNEGFKTIDQDKEAIKINQKYGIPELMQQAAWDIEHNNWNSVKDAIKKIKTIFKIKEEDDAPMQEGMVTMVGGQPGDQEADGNGQEGHGQGEGNGLAIKPGDVGNVDRFLRPGSAWDKGEGIKGPSRDIIGEAAFQDITRESFKELLCIKERRVIFEGAKLNTDAFPSFFTGDIEELFHEHDIEKVKKSKIAFCLDASGSMQSRMFDGSDRRDVLVKTTRSIISIIKDIQEQEGLNISFDIWAFDFNAEKLPEDWERHYTARGGGTNLYQAFQDVQADILANQEIDGNKLVILMTDGEVGSDEIENLRQQILKHGAEVRCMVVGIGASLDGAFVHTIAGESNIIGQEHADAVIMDTIKAMLD